jgi:hypothetical protein
MHSRDYILIAKAISEIRSSYINSDMGHEIAYQRVEALNDLTINLCHYMQGDNPKFDRQLFKTAAGMK